MKLFYKAKDGGPESSVTGYWLIEWKQMFSIVLLRFDGASREAYHNHAFSAISWLLSGFLNEEVLGWQEGSKMPYKPSWRPIWTPWRQFHKVSSKGRSWAISFRGPWRDTWKEYLPASKALVELRSGREPVRWI